MARSNRALVSTFIDGETSGSSANMQIREGPLSYDGTTYVLEGETALVGYGWAIYAKNTGSRIIVFEGWRGWAESKDGQSGRTTLSHLRLVKQISGPTMMYDHRKAQCSDAPRTAETMTPSY